MEMMKDLKKNQEDIRNSQDETKEDLNKEMNNSQAENNKALNKCRTARTK